MRTSCLRLTVVIVVIVVIVATVATILNRLPRVNSAHVPDRLLRSWRSLLRARARAYSRHLAAPRTYLHIRRERRAAACTKSVAHNVLSFIFPKISLYVSHKYLTTATTLPSIAALSVIIGSIKSFSGCKR